MKLIFLDLRYRRCVIDNTRVDQVIELRGGRATELGLKKRNARRDH